MEPSHYAGTDAIAKQELVALRLVEMGAPADRAFCAATALKYVERCGKKKGASVADDMNKATDYLFRAIGGCWPWEAKKSPKVGSVCDADGVPLLAGERVWHEDGTELMVKHICYDDVQDGEPMVIVKPLGDGTERRNVRSLSLKHRPWKDGDDE